MGSEIRKHSILKKIVKYWTMAKVQKLSNSEFLDLGPS
jgi:hypothetical protein